MSHSVRNTTRGGDAALSPGTNTPLILAYPAKRRSTRLQRKNSHEFGTRTILSFPVLVDLESTLKLSKVRFETNVVAVEALNAISFEQPFAISAGLASSPRAR